MTAATTKTGDGIRLRSRGGFTLIELMIVLTIIAILSAIAIPNYQWALIRAREAVLQENLYGIRSAIDQFHADLGRYPDKLEDLAARKYLRDIPKDPFTKKDDSWIIVPPPAELPPETADGSTAAVGTLPLPKGNVYDVQSGSELIGSNGIPYKDW